MSLSHVFSLSNTPFHFVAPDTLLLEQGTGLAACDVRQAPPTFQNFPLLEQYDSISSWCTSSDERILIVSVQGMDPRIEVFSYPSMRSTQVITDGTCDYGYSHLTLSANAKFLIAISRVPELQMEYWNIEEGVKLTSVPVEDENVIFAAMSPTDDNLYYTATPYRLTLWRIYYKFGEYFITSIEHQISQPKPPATPVSRPKSSARSEQSSHSSLPIRRKKPTKKATPTAPQPVVREIIQITWGEKGEEVVLVTNKNELIVCTEHNAHDRRVLLCEMDAETAHTGDAEAQTTALTKSHSASSGSLASFFNSNTADLQSMPWLSDVLFTKHFFVTVFGNTGQFRWYRRSDFVPIYSWSIDSNESVAVRSVVLSPDWKSMLVTTYDWQILRCKFDTLLLFDESQSGRQVENMQERNLVQSVIMHSFLSPPLEVNQERMCPVQYASVVAFHGDKLQFLSCDEGDLSSTQALVDVEFEYGAKVSHLDVFHFVNGVDCVAIGFENGFVGIGIAHESFRFKLVFIQKLHSVGDVQVSFNLDGTWIASVGTDSKLWFVRVQDQMIAGYVSLAWPATGLCWSNTYYNEPKVVVSTPEKTLLVVDIPEEDVDTSHVADVSELALDHLSVVESEVPEVVLKMVRHPEQKDHVVCVTNEKQLRGLVVDDDGTIFSDDTFCYDCHYREPSVLCIRSDLIVTAGRDGMIQIRDLTDPHQIIYQFYAHDSWRNGVKNFALTFDGETLVSTGGDGSTICWTLPEYAFAPSDDPQFMCPIALPQAHKMDAPEMDLEVEMYVNQEQNRILDEKRAAFEPLMKEIQDELVVVREQYGDVVQQNTAADELSKLGADDLIVDVDAYETMNQETEQQIEKLRGKIDNRNLEKQLITKRLKEQFWDSMQQKMTCVCGIRSLDEVTAFPLRNFENEELVTWKKMEFLRTMSQKEHEWSVQSQYRRNADFEVREFTKGNPMDYVWDINDEKTDDPTFEVAPELRQLLFHPMELFSNVAKRIQIQLLHQRVHSVKEAFNKQITQLFQSKQQEVEKLNDLAAQIRDIQRELGLDDEIFQPTMASHEFAEHIFNVDESQIKSKKVLTPAEAERIRREEEQRLAREAAAKTSASARALSEMMGGTLDSKDEVEKLADLLKKPGFMDDIPEHEWSDEQKQSASAYQEKKDALEKAKEIRSKMLVTQLKKCRSDIADIVRNFDNHVKSMFEKRLRVLEDAYGHELMAIRLSNDLVEFERDDRRIATIDEEIKRFEADSVEASETFAKFSDKLQECRDKLQELQNEARRMDKSFKKDMSHAGDYFDYLQKLFKGKKAVPPNIRVVEGDEVPRRRRGSIIGRRSMHGASLNAMKLNVAQGEFIDPLDPYATEQEKPKDPLAALECPEMLPYAIWESFLRLKRQQLKNEKAIAEETAKAQSMEVEVSALNNNLQVMEDSVIELKQVRTALVERRETYKLDTELFLQVKQGQVEVKESPVVTDMRQVILVDKGIVSHLNSIISQMGNEKISRLHEIKDFRRGINILNWKAKVLDLQHRYYTMLTTEYQLRRVTKRDQEVIKAGGQESKQKHEVEQLEKKLEFTKRSYERKIRECRQNVTKVQTRMDDLMDGNAKLSHDIDNLRRDVQEKEDILNIRGTQSVASEKLATRRKAMDAVVTRRKLVDLVRAQSEEIQFLRVELDKLRRKTFPSFSHTKPPLI